MKQETLATGISNLGFATYAVCCAAGMVEVVTIVQKVDPPNPVSLIEYTSAQKYVTDARGQIVSLAELQQYDQIPQIIGAPTYLEMKQKMALYQKAEEEKNNAMQVRFNSWLSSRAGLYGAGILAGAAAFFIGRGIADRRHHWSPVVPT